MNALATLETLTPSAVFIEGGAEAIISKLETEVRATIIDIGSEAGRKAAKSLAYKVTRSKTALDEMGKSLVADIKAKAGLVDADRRLIRDRLDALAEEVKAPAVAWENAEQDRIAGHEEALVWIIQSSQFVTPPTVIEIERRLSVLADYLIRDFEEFAPRADEAVKDALEMLQSKMAISRQFEADQAELAELRRLKAEREDADTKAAEQARQEAWEKERAAHEAKRAADYAEAEALRAKLAAEKAEQRAQEAAEQAERDKAEAIERAVIDERLRASLAEKAEKLAQERREADKAHRAKFNNEVIAALERCGLSIGDGKGVLTAIVRGEIPHISISY